MQGPKDTQKMLTFMEGDERKLSGRGGSLVQARHWLVMGHLTKS